MYRQAVQATEAAQFRGHPIELEVFQGPLDLLLHLIKKDQIEIWEISISRITRQYLEYLATLQALNIEVAGDFLVMAATLMRIKSQNLLPRPSFLVYAEEADEPLTRDALIARLVEYKRFREAARAMQQLEAEQLRTHPVGSPAALGPRHQLPLREPRLIDLAEYLRELLLRAEPTPGHEVHLEEVKLEEQIDWIRGRLATEEDWEELPELGRSGIPFRRLLRRPWMRIEIAVTFLAALELARLQHLRLWQRSALEEIWILARPLEERTALETGLQPALEVAAGPGEDAAAAPSTDLFDDLSAGAAEDHGYPPDQPRDAAGPGAGEAEGKRPEDHLETHHEDHHEEKA